MSLSRRGLLGALGALPFFKHLLPAAEPERGYVDSQRLTYEFSQDAALSGPHCPATLELFNDFAASSPPCYMSPADLINEATRRTYTMDWLPEETPPGESSGGQLG